ncbi:MULTISPECIES: helix-turn-helix domain-containing protein [unclassified Ruegeria]|uniref:helix-turn-helix domain-containing protein n=1 Tax=unclassified Ruegeria TaxID=2625375 RepID=UPI001489AEFF|nr:MULTISPECIES: XRE family transcriptional regulator [unclassified Ruegeria]NOD64750.1 helix-turn-helix domain-containing protein [Ruegeria sp. HKCCD6109]NOD77738.1 helix-turn-helix domain-containing protein [Ruegeria sp. HKCCD4332]NOD89946.1 helix-turn-helix domain-containing protein [Ruegeria sp. HKCCD4318]NOD95305.1 helix-turn-helix domain-containing protein [Ruegeria sp. HKCCD4884]NOE14608.1 helix-turn-helix domain-containing protein [Ruegeria sp. HKCCD4318-2]
MGDDHWNEGSVQDEEDEGAALGRSIRDARREKGWTLEEAGRAAGIGRSTLSKIENNQTKPSFEIVRRLTQALDMNPPQLFLETGQSGISGRRDFTAKGQGETRETATYLHELLCSDLTSKRMLPYIATIRARDMSEFDPLVRHSGEEFMYVLSGELIFLSEHYRPLPMKAGDSLYYDSGMGHGCISTSKEDAKVLWVSLD